MLKEILPREHAAPERFQGYVASRNPAHLAEMQDEVYRLVLAEVAPAAIAEQVEEEGWDREFAFWVATFTHAQRRPIRAMTHEALDTKRWWEVRRKEFRRYNSITLWSCALFTAIFCGLLVVPGWIAQELWPLYLLAIAVASVAMIRGFAGVVHLLTKQRG